MTPTELILSAVRQHGGDPRPAGVGWSCRCPAHDDQKPSLSINTGNDGRVLVKCHRGCTPEEIVGAVGLTLADLFPKDPHHPSRRNGHAPRPRRRGDGDRTSRKPAGGAGSVASAGVAKPRKTFPTAAAAVADMEATLKRGPRAGMWPYHDAAGNPVGLVVRWDLPEGKDVRAVWLLPDGSGWVWKGLPKPLPLYHLPELVATKPGGRVWVVEGEKTAEAARALGLVATTSVGGAKRAKGADWGPTAGLELVISPDRDTAGDDYAADVTGLALAAGALSVRVVNLLDLWADLPEGGDMADFVERTGGDTDAMGKLRADVEALADRAQAIEPQSPSQDTALAFTPFPVDALPSPIQRFVLESATAIGCDSSFLVLPLLSALASAIGNTYRISLKRKWSEPAIIWTAIVAASGTKKSPPIELALEPIRKRQDEAMRRHVEAMTQYADTMAKYERDTGQWRNSSTNTAPPTKPEVPIAERYWTDDATVEALVTLLQQNPRGLLMARDELSGWFDFGRYANGKGGAVVAKFLEMFGGRAMMADRRGGNGPIYIPHAAVSITGSITPDALRRALGEEYLANGLAARLLYADPPRKVLLWTEADVSPEAEAAIVKVFDRLYSLRLERSEDGQDRPHLLPLAPDGKVAWVRFYNEHAREQMKLSGDEAAAWSKLEGYAARFALIVHLCRWASDDPTLADFGTIDAASVAAGVAMTRWFGDEARRLYSMLAESGDDRDTRELVEWIAAQGCAVTARDLARGPRKFRDTLTATTALCDLVSRGFGHWEFDSPGAEGGRPTDRFRLLSPTSTTGDGDETPANAGNRKGSVAVATDANPQHDGGEGVQ